MFQVQHCTTKPRQATLTRGDDLDMALQHRYSQARREEAQVLWISNQTPKPFACRDELRFIKMLVVEAERYQEERSMKWLRLEVVRRANTTVWPQGYITKTRTSVLVNRDVDTVLTLPTDVLPEEGRAAAAKNAVVTLPLWQKPAWMVKRETKAK